MLRAARLLPLLLFASCNTCLSASEVPFRGDGTDLGADHGAEDQGAEDMGSGEDASGDASRPPDQCETLDWCALAGRVCGSFAPDDPCAPATLDCGICGDGAMCTEDGECACLAGYMADGAICEDIDECANGTDNCTDDMFCINEPGSFRCSVCPAGQELGAMGCVDVDECATNADDCDDLVTCTNLDPGYECGDCPVGYLDDDGDGTSCSDIDECANDTDNCDVNATCTNQPGSFTCACNAGYQGNGVTCTTSQNSLVVSVNTVQLAMNNNQTTEATPVPAGVNSAQVVPFATLRTEGALDPDDVLVDVYIDGNEVMIEREGNDGELIVEVSLVEFDPSVTVQGDTFDLTGTSENVAVPNLDRDQAFLVFTNKVTVGQERSAGLVRGSLTSTGLARFQRAASSGTASGHFYVVSSPALAVTHGTVTIGILQVCDSVSLQANDPTRAFLLYSTAGGSFMGGSLNTLNTNCRMTVNDVECCRADTDFVSGATAEVQLVEFLPASNSIADRGEVTITGTTAQDNLVTAVDAVWSTVLAGPSGAAGGALVEQASSDDDLGQVTGVLVSGSQVLLERGDLDAIETTSWWQVVQWPHP